MKYNVFSCLEGADHLCKIICDAPTIDAAVSNFISHCRTICADPCDLLTKTKYVIDEDYGSGVGFMIWAEVRGVGKPILVLQRYDRNVLYMYDVNGNLMRKDKIT